MYVREVLFVIKHFVFCFLVLGDIFTTSSKHILSLWRSTNAYWTNIIIDERNK